jgi:hypothetical protein
VSRLRRQALQPAKVSRAASMSDRSAVVAPDNQPPLAIGREANVRSLPDCRRALTFAAR